MLCPNNRQKTKLFECAGTARFIYNWVLDYEQINYDCDNGFVSDYELRKRLTELKKTHSRFMWLNHYSNNIAKQAVKDACNAYLNFFRGIAGFPNYKSRRKSKPSFYVDTDKISFTDTNAKKGSRRLACFYNYNHLHLFFDLSLLYFDTDDYEEEIEIANLPSYIDEDDFTDEDFEFNYKNVRKFVYKIEDSFVEFIKKYSQNLYGDFENYL